MIIYFSATGNCKYVAKRIAEATGDIELSMLDCIEKNQKEIKDSVIGIISPTYNYTLPVITRDFLSEAKLDADYLFYVSTYGTSPGGTGKHAKKLIGKADHPMEFLKGFSGFLVTDGYEAYHKLARARKDEIRIAGCWVHLKRKYTDAVKAMGKAGADTVAGTLSGQAIQMIQNLFHEDNKLEKMEPEDRQKRREEEIRPLVDQFFVWVNEHRNEVTRKSVTGRAFTYTIEQEDYLRTFLSDGRVPMDNNAAERAIRPFCIGKKNWVMCDTIHGAKDSAIVYSLTETAKANDLKPYEYLDHLLTVIPQHMEDTDLAFLDDLLPWSDALPDNCRK